MFYEVDFSTGCEQCTQIVGYLFEPMSGADYKKILIGNIEPNGGDPKIKSVFFANADNDSLKELIVIASWEQLLHADYGGTAYSTLVFHAPESDATTKLTFNEDISNKLDGGCDCEWSNGRKSKAKYKTAAGVKARLKALGH